MKNYCNSLVVAKTKYAEEGYLLSKRSKKVVLLKNKSRLAVSAKRLSGE